MRTEKFNSALLSTLIIVSLITPAITLLSVSLASAEPDPEEIIIQGDANAYNTNVTGVPPWKPYKVGDLPPIMAAKEIGSGAVFAAGLGRTTNGGVGYATQRWTSGELDVLLDNAFQWMVPGAENVLWYGEYIDETEGTYEYAFNNAEAGSWLIDALEAKGYSVDNTIDGSFTPITPTLLSEYDILVTPGLQVGDGASGGNPDLLLDNVVGFIKDFVEGGKGLFIMDVADYDGYNFYKVQNKILEELNFGLYFQSDTILNDIYTDPREFNADVNNVLFGADYRTATGKTTIKVYKVCSLAPELENYAVSVEILPSYREGLAGGTLEYEVKVTNVGKITDHYNLDVSDNIWPTTISPSVLELENNFTPQYATLSVTITPGTPIGTVDNVAVIATSEDKPEVSSSSVCLAIVENRARPSNADAQVVEAEPDENYGERSFMYVGSSATGVYKNEIAFVKFDLKALGTASVDNVRLYLYGFAINGMPDNTVRLHRVDSPWLENEINWNHQPEIGAVFPAEETVVDTDRWYSWDVTSYVNNQRDNDNLASFALCYKEGEENATYPDNWSYGFDTKEYNENFAHPYLAIGPSVRTVVRSYKEGLPGGELKYTVIVQNTGALHDTYNLENYDNAGWDLTILPDSLELPPGALGTATVTVTIPSDAPIGENIDNITVVATSTVDSTVSDNSWFVANVSGTKIGPPEDDSTAKQAEPLGNWVLGTLDEDGEPAKIEVGRESGGPVRGFLKFDLKAIPSLENIKRARLWLNAEDVKDVGAVVRVYSMDDTWVERGAGRLMWNNWPSIGEVLDVRGVVEADKQYFWDVTDFVRDQFENDSQKLASFALVDLGENIPPNLHKASFISKESEIRENHPYLEILTTVPERGVRAYISPVFQGGLPGTITYIVTVTNTGTEPDSYDLSASDTESWVLAVLPLTLSLGAGESDNATLSVTIPSVDVCTLDRITVTATGTGVSDSAIAFAHVSGVEFNLENLYKISIDLNIRLREDADNLVAKFYTYDGGYQAESVVWENMPWQLISKKYVPHPQSIAVEKVMLVLVDGTGAEIATVATFIVTRDDLFSRIRAIKGRWPYASPDERDALFAEIRGIKGKWPYAS